MTMGTMNQITDLNAPAALSRRTPVAAPAPSPAFAAPNTLNAVPSPPPPPPRDADTQLNPKNKAFEFWGSSKNHVNHPSKGLQTLKTASDDRGLNTLFTQNSTDFTRFDRYFDGIDTADGRAFAVAAHCVNNTKTHNNSNIRTLTGGEGLEKVIERSRTCLSRRKPTDLTQELRLVALRPAASTSLSDRSVVCQRSVRRKTGLKTRSAVVYEPTPPRKLPERSRRELTQDLRLVTLTQDKEPKMTSFMYILKCADGSYYTGSTKNLERRLAQHRNGEGANFTGKHLPVELVYVEEYSRIDEAFYREKQVQGWSRAKKKALIDRQYGKLPELAGCANDSRSVRRPVASTPLSDRSGEFEEKGR